MTSSLGSAMCLSCTVCYIWNAYLVLSLGILWYDCLILFVFGSVAYFGVRNELRAVNLYLISHTSGPIAHSPHHRYHKTESMQIQQHSPHTFESYLHAK